MNARYKTRNQSYLLMLDIPAKEGEACPAFASPGMVLIMSLLSQLWRVLVIHCPVLCINYSKPFISLNVSFMTLHRLSNVLLDKKGLSKTTFL